MAPTTARSRLGGGRRRLVGPPPPPALLRRRADRGQQVGGLYLRMSSEARRAALDVRAEQSAASLRSRSPLSDGREVRAAAVATSSQSSQPDDDDGSCNGSSNDRCGARREEEEEEEEEGAAESVRADRRVAMRRSRRRSAMADGAADGQHLFAVSPSAGDDDGRCGGNDRYRRLLPAIGDSRWQSQLPSWGGERRYEQPAALSRRQRQLLLENAVAAAADGSNGGDADCRERSRTVLPALTESGRSGGRPPQRRMMLQPLAGASAALRRQPTALFETTPRGYDSRYRAVALRALEGFRSAEEEQEQERQMGEIREAAVQKCLPWLRQAIAN